MKGNGEAYAPDCTLLISEIEKKFPLSKMSPSYETDLIDYVVEIMREQLSLLFDELPEQYEDLSNQIANVVNLILADGSSRIRRQMVIPQSGPGKPLSPEALDSLKLIMAKIEAETKELPSQMTEGWYLHRNMRLTASSAWKMFGTPAQLNALIYAKCSPKEASQPGVCMTGPLYHGVKYEDVSIQIYERDFQTRVGEYGCKDHELYPFLAASPDGINTCLASPKFGTMVEVKNIVNREITGIPKFEYWIQMQIQMEVFNLPYCDFLETEIREYESYNEFKADGSFSQSILGQQKGMVMTFYCSDKTIRHEYSGLDMSYDDAERWSQQMMEKNAGATWVSNSYWRLIRKLVTGVARDVSWFKAALPIIEKTSQIIAAERESGAYKLRASKRRKNNVVGDKDLNAVCIVPDLDHSGTIVVDV